MNIINLTDSVAFCRVMKGILRQEDVTVLFRLEKLSG